MSIRVRVLSLLLVVLATRAPFFFYDFVNVDEAAHWVGAGELLGDGALYTTFVDNKPPLIYFVYALGRLLGGSMAVVRLVSALLLVFPTALAAGACFLDRHRQNWAALLFSTLSAAFVAADTQAVNTELVMLLPLAWTTVILQRQQPSHENLEGWRTLAACGALVGLATLAKQPALSFLAAVVVADRPSKDWISFASVHRALAAMLGCAASLGLSAWVLSSHGQWEAFWYWAFVYNLAHVDQPVSLGDVSLRALKMLLPLFAVWAIPTVAAARAVSFRGRKLFSAGLTCALFPAFLGARFFGHYFIPAMFFLACLATPTWASWMARRPKLTVSYVVSLPATFVVVNLLLYRPQGVADVAFPIHEQVGNVIAKDSDCPGSLFVWGYTPMMYYYSERPPASRFVVPIDTVSGYLSGNEAFERGELDTSSRIVPEHRALLLTDLKTNEPSHIVDTSGSGLALWDRFPLSSFPDLENYVGNHYQPFWEEEGMTIFRRKDCADPK